MKAEFLFIDRFKLIAENPSDVVLLNNLFHEGNGEVYTLENKNNSYKEPFNDLIEVEFQLRKNIEKVNQ